MYTQIMAHNVHFKFEVMECSTSVHLYNNNYKIPWTPNRFKSRLIQNNMPMCQMPNRL